MYEGKKVFFILPHGIVEEHLIDILSDHEYEVYTIKDPTAIGSLASRFPNSIMYINVDGVYKDHEWKRRIKDLIDDNPDLLVGVLTNKITEGGMAKSYILEVGISAGIVQLHQGVKESSNVMLKVLEACEARGRRKYLRYKCKNNRNVTLNFNWYNKQRIGTIIDISSVGLSCSFEEPLDISKNQVIPDVQLKLVGILVTTDCICVGSREDLGTMIYVFIFRTNNRKNLKTKVRQFINSSLQKDMEQILPH